MARHRRERSLNEIKGGKEVASAFADLRRTLPTNPEVFEEKLLEALLRAGDEALAKSRARRKAPRKRGT